MRPEIAVRPYRSADAQATLDVFGAAIRGTASQFYDSEQIDAWAPGDDADVARWNALREQACTVVAELGRRVVGSSDLTDDVLLDMLFVHPSAGGRGVARTLVGAVLDRATELGLVRVVTHASRAARPAFEKFGFVVHAENVDNEVRGIRVPNFDMHADLSPPPGRE